MLSIYPLETVASKDLLRVGDDCIFVFINDEPNPRVAGSEELVGPACFCPDAVKWAVSRAGLIVVGNRDVGADSVADLKRARGIAKHHTYIRTEIQRVDMWSRFIREFASNDTPIFLAIIPEPALPIGTLNPKTFHNSFRVRPIRARS